MGGKRSKNLSFCWIEYRTLLADPVDKMGPCAALQQQFGDARVLVKDGIGTRRHLFHIDDVGVGDLLETETDQLDISAAGSLK